MADGWTIKEKLYLVTAVSKNGENNWASVSKLMRTIPETDRVPEFFSQKNCAQQYTALVEAFPMPRRKRTDTTPSPSSEPTFTAGHLVEKLKELRLEELKRIIQQEQAQFRKAKREIELIRSGQLDHQLSIILEQRLAGRSPSAVAQLLTSDNSETAPSDTSTILSESPVKTATEPEPKLVATPKPPPTPESISNVLSPTQQPDIKSLLASPKTPSTPQQPTEFVSPSKTPSLSIVRPTSPLISPSMSPSGAAMAIQGALLSPAKSVSRSPPRAMDNPALQSILQRLRSPSPASTPATIGTSGGTTALLKQMPEAQPVVQLEELPASQIAAAKAGTFEESSSDSDEEKKPLATLKTPPASAAPMKSVETPAATPIVEPQETVEKPTVDSVRSPPRVEPLKIRVDSTAEKPPKRVMPPRGRAAVPAPTSQRRKQNSGGSTTSSEASSTVRTPAPASTSGASRSPLPVPAPFPDNETYRQWKKMILNVWNMAAGHRHASLFLQPVKDSIAPGYSKLIKKPVDLSTIKKNIENGTLTSTEQVRLELLMMFANAVMYNATNTEVNQMAREMAEDVMKHLDDLLVPINAMFSGGGVEATKSLRSNRRQAAAATPLSEATPRRAHAKRQRLHSDDETSEKQASKRQK